MTDAGAPRQVIAPGAEQASQDAPTAFVRSSRPSNRLGTGGRVVAGVFAALCLAVLITAAMLHPDARGHGTHQQLGLPACGWVMMFGKPCPTCGMTTSFSLLAHGRVVDAFRTQPFGALLCLGTACAFWIALHGAVFAARVDRVAMPLLQPRTVWVVLGMLGAAWVYTIATFQRGV